MIIRVIIHIDTIGRKDLKKSERMIYHSCEIYHDEKSALDGTNKELENCGLINGLNIISSCGIKLINTLIAKRFDDALNESNYIRWDDIEEDLIIKCSEQFCEHHWEPDLLLKIAKDIGIDIEDI